jgi:hypothetical protein
MPGRKKQKEKNPVHEALEGLNLSINEMGEVRSNLDISRINRFLDDHTTDKKLSDKQKTEKDEPEAQKEE